MLVFGLASGQAPSMVHYRLTQYLPLLLVSASKFFGLSRRSHAGRFIHLVSFPATPTREILPGPIRKEPDSKFIIGMRTGPQYEMSVYEYFNVWPEFILSKMQCTSVL